MDGNREGKFGGAGKTALRAFGLTGRMDVRRYIVNQEQESKSSQQADNRRPNTP